MLTIETFLESFNELLPGTVSLNASFHIVYKKIKGWVNRFPFSTDISIFNDLCLFYLLAAKQFLDHRTPLHLFRLSLSLHVVQKKLLHAVTLAPHSRHLKIRWMPTHLLFPFASKPVLGCLIGFNLTDRYEVFDEENVLLALQKHLPKLRLVNESSYCHASPHKNLKIFYFEIENKTGTSFSFLELNLLKNNLEEKVKNSIQTLSPNIFMRQNEEEIYKNILVLSQEIQSLQDFPQAFILFDRQTGKEIVFRIILVQVAPFHRFSLKDRFFDCQFVPQKSLTVRYLDGIPIEAHVFSLYLQRNPNFLRSDGSLDFYSARQKVVHLMKAAIGEFRDYNGGIIIKQQEQLYHFKETFPHVATDDSEFMETFFYSLTPLEQQIVLSKKILAHLFRSFLDHRKGKFSKYSFKTYTHEDKLFISVRSEYSSLNKVVTNVLHEHPFKSKGIAYNFLETAEGTFFNCVLLNPETNEAISFVQALHASLHHWYKQKKERQILRIAMEHSIVSLDPRIGGESISTDILRLLFERLTRFNQKGDIENALAESIQISSDAKEYLFKLRSTFWNDGSPVTAYDFEYAWKKILSPDFKTSFAYFFDPIKNAKLAKEGKVPLEEVGIKVQSEQILKVELTHPTPYFLELTAHPLFSPVHHLIDQTHPQWPYQSEKSYPCNGPFQIKINRPNQGYQLIKNPLYYDASHIVLDQITLTHMSSSQAYQAFQRNEVDWIGNPFGSWNPFFIPGEEDRLVSLPKGWALWLVFNTTFFPFHHKKLRRAFAYAIERAQIVSESFFKLTPALSSLSSDYQPNPKALFPDFHLEKAVQLFEEALSELNMQRTNFPPISLIFTEKGIREHVAISLKKQFKECFGITCELKPLSWSPLFHKLTAGDFQLGLAQWISRIDDPIYTLNSFRVAGQEINFAKWEHVEFQRLLDLSDHEVNPFQRSSYLLQAEEILCEEAPIIPLIYQTYHALIKKDLHITHRDSIGLFNISNSYFGYKNKEI